jgi:hypothetical protein
MSLSCGTIQVYLPSQLAWKPPRTVSVGSRPNHSGGSVDGLCGRGPRSRHRKKGVRPRGTLVCGAAARRQRRGRDHRPFDRPVGPRSSIRRCRVDARTNLPCSGARHSGQAIQGGSPEGEAADATAPRAHRWTRALTTPPQTERNAVVPLEHWVALIHAWSAAADLAVLIRKARDNRRRELRHESGRILIPTDNSPAHWSMALTLCRSRPSLDDVRTMLAEDRVSVEMGHQGFRKAKASSAAPVRVPPGPKRSSPIRRVTALGEVTELIAHEVNQPLRTVVTSANACARCWSMDVPEPVARAERRAPHRRPRSSRCAPQSFRTIRRLPGSNLRKPKSSPSYQASSLSFFGSTARKAPPTSVRACLAILIAAAMSVGPRPWP